MEGGYSFKSVFETYLNFTLIQTALTVYLLQYSPTTGRRDYRSDKSPTLFTRFPFFLILTKSEFCSVIILYCNHHFLFEKKLKLKRNTVLHELFWFACNGTPSIGVRRYGTLCQRTRIGNSVFFLIVCFTSHCLLVKISYSLYQNLVE